MDKNKGIPKSKGVPIIGGKGNEEVIKNAIDTALATLTQHLDPILGNFGQAIEELQKEFAIIREIVDATLVDIIAKRVYDKIQNKLNYPDAKPQGCGGVEWRAIKKEKK